MSCDLSQALIIQIISCNLPLFEAQIHYVISDACECCFVVPKYFGRRHDFASSMKFMKSLPVNSLCGTALSSAECRSDGMERMDVWYDSAENLRLNSALDKFKALRTLTRANIDKFDAHAFFDSGASADFIDKSHCDRKKLTVLPTSVSVRCAGADASIECIGMVKANLKLGPFREAWKFYVIDLPPGLDVCLSDSWLDEHGAILHYPHKYVQLKKGKKTCRIHFDRHVDTDSLPPPPLLNMPILSVIQAKRMMRKHECKAFLVNVTKTDSDNDHHDDSDRLYLIEETLKGYECVFNPLPDGLPPDRGLPHTIDTGNNPPVSRPMYRLSAKEKLEVETQVKD